MFDQMIFIVKIKGRQKKKKPTPGLGYNDDLHSSWPKEQDHENCNIHFETQYNIIWKNICFMLYTITHNIYNLNKTNLEFFKLMPLLQSESYYQLDDKYKFIYKYLGVPHNKLIPKND